MTELRKVGGRSNTLRSRLLSDGHIPCLSLDVLRRHDKNVSHRMGNIKHLSNSTEEERSREKRTRALTIRCFLTGLGRIPSIPARALVAMVGGFT